MIKVVSIEKMRQIEAAADAMGLSYDQMMRRAGQAVARRALVQMVNNARVTVLVGAGNNGGDGLVAGLTIAQESSALVRFYLLKARDETDVHFKAVREAGLFVAYAEHDRDQRVLHNMVASADIVIDALFGIGVRLPLADDAARMLRAVRQALRDDRRPENEEPRLFNPAESSYRRRPARPYVIAVDCPSGLNCDTGELDASAVPANETVTFIAAKKGLFLFPGAEAVGELNIATLGVPDDLAEQRDESTFVVDMGLARDLLPLRPADANKGTFGKVLMVAGSGNTSGAAGLAAMAAYRVGAGLVTVGAPAPVIQMLAARFLEPTWLMLPHDMGVATENAAGVVQSEMPRFDALLIGPGLGREATTRALLRKLLELPVNAPDKARRLIGFAPGQIPAASDGMTTIRLPPLVLDADALNLLAEIEDWPSLLPPNTVLTPHPGEMARLTKTEIADVQSRRWELAREKAVAWQVVLLLKGAHTLVAAPDGRLAVLPFKTDALATAGTGDVLAGVIAGLLAQGVQPFEAAVGAAYLHGYSGVSAAYSTSSRAVTAGDVLDGLPAALAVIEAS